MSGNTDPQYDYLLKYLIIGSSGVGKSSLLLRYIDDKYSNEHIVTIGVDFKIKTLNIKNKKTKINIWDTAGQERFKGITGSYYKGASGVMVVYDITDAESFNKVNDWLIEIEKNAPNAVYKILIGNKSDLLEARQVSFDQGKELADTYGMKFIETSAKSSTNVENAFITMTEDIIESKMKSTKEKPKQQNVVLNPNKGNDLTEKKKGCC